MRRSFFALTFFLVLHSTTRGQSSANSTRLFLPVMSAAGVPRLGIALTNPTLEAAEVKLTARSYSGETISGDGITNPATITLPPQGQRAAQLTEVFAAGISGRSGWVVMTPSSPAVKGLFLLFDDAATAIDGSSMADTASSNFIFPNGTAETSLTF